MEQARRKSKEAQDLLSPVYSDTTQLNSTRRRVELSWVQLCRYKRGFSSSAAHIPSQTRSHQWLEQFVIRCIWWYQKIWIWLQDRQESPAVARLPIDSLPMVSYNPITSYIVTICKKRRFGDTRLLKLPWPWNPGHGSLCSEISCNVK